jgi:hypothetical protein
MIRPTKTNAAGCSLRRFGSADTWGDSGDYRTGDASVVRELALVGVDAARQALHRYALATDSPELGMVEAADHLDAARDALTGGAVL